jgi:hypothetical protein
MVRVLFAQNKTPFAIKKSNYCQNFKRVNDVWLPHGFSLASWFCLCFVGCFNETLWHCISIDSVKCVKRTLGEKNKENVYYSSRYIEYIAVCTVYSHSAKVSNYFIDCLAELNHRLIVSYWKFPWNWFILLAMKIANTIKHKRSSLAWWLFILWRYEALVDIAAASPRGFVLLFCLILRNN